MKFLVGLFALFISPAATQVVYADTANFVILDVRTQEEFSEKHVTGAVNIDVLKADFKEKVEKLDRNKTYKLYCRSGNRSGKALLLMKEMGFKDLENLGSLQQAAKTLNKGYEEKVRHDK